MLEVSYARHVQSFGDGDEAPCDPAAQPFAWTWVSGGGHVSVARDHGRIIHPWCSEFRRRGTCRHVVYATRLTEEPLVVLAESLVAAWQQWGRFRPEEYAAAAFRAAEGARRRYTARAEWLSQPPVATSVADVVARYG